MRADRIASAVSIFTVLVALSVVIALTALLWHAIGLIANKPVPVSAATAPRGDVDIAPAVALAPFGRADARFAPQTSLALQLRGVMMAVPREKSTALIAATGGIPIAYVIGQPVPGGTLEDIEVDRVLLRVNGRLERLDLPRVSTATASPAPSGFGQSPLPPGAMAPAPPPMTEPNANTPPPRPIAALFESVPASPASGGYRVGAPLSPNASRAGLQPGDLIEQINGTPVNGLSADRDRLASLMASGYAQVSVLRGNRRLSLSFPFR